MTALDKKGIAILRYALLLVPLLVSWLLALGVGGATVAGMVDPKIASATGGAAGLLTAGTIAACGGGSGGGHRHAYQGGYNEALRGGSQAAGQTSHRRILVWRPLSGLSG